MKYPTHLFPQSDTVSDFNKLVEAISKNHRTDYEIEHYMGKDSEGRQGRYYRKAVETLGLIVTDRNYSDLTPLGKDYLRASTDKKLRIMAKGVLDNPVFKEILRFLNSKGGRGATKDELENFVVSIYGGAKSTARRRTTTIINLITYLDLARRIGDRIIATKIPFGALIEETFDPIEPILPTKTDLKMLLPQEQKKRDRLNQPKIVKYYVNEIKKEKADVIHHDLVALMAKKIVENGLTPKCNGFVDLCTKDGDTQYLFEMKSVRSKNMIAQVRKGISQLYEYRYRMDMKDPFLCLVLSREPSGKKFGWLIDYLVEDRKIHVCWRKKDRFECSPASTSAIGRFM